MDRPAPIAVTGATGQVGGRVARRLAERGVALRLIVRDPSTAPELGGAHAVQATYSDPDALRHAFDGIETLFLVSASEAADRVRLHITAIDAAVAAGVQRIVYLSFVGAAPDCTFTFGRDHWHTEEHIRSTGLRYTLLRDNMYMDFLPFFPGEDGVIRGPAGDGAVAAVARDDIADVAVSVLLGGPHNGATYDLTGPEALTLGQIAEVLTRYSGRTITYYAENLEEAYASRAKYGAPDWEVAGWVSSYVAIAAGELEVVSDAVARIAGHPPMSFVEYLDKHPRAYEHLAARPQAPS